MTTEQVIDIAREGSWVIVLVSGPALAVALLVGIVISLFQALTQIQEATLSFVPKVLAVLATLILTTPFSIAVLRRFTETLYERIAAGGI